MQPAIGTKRKLREAISQRRAHDRDRESISSIGLHQHLFAGDLIARVTPEGILQRGFLGLFGREDALGETFHITSDEVLTWNQAYEEVARALDVELNVVHIPSDLIAKYDEHAIGSLIGDKSNSAVFDNSKIKRFVPEFECKVPWAEGIRRTIDWFEADPGRQTIDESANQLWDKIIAAYERAYP